MGHAHPQSETQFCVTTDRYTPSYEKSGLTMMYHRTSRAIYWA